MVHKNKWLKVLVTSSMVLGSYACTDSKTSEEYQAEAEVFIEKNDTKSAIIALKNALSIAPQDAAIRFKLGIAYLDRGDYPNAEKELEKAERLGFDANQLLPRLIEAKFKLQKFKEVYSLTSSAEGLIDSSYVQVLTYAGLSSLYQGNRDKAQEFIDNANLISSESAYGQIGKAYLAQTVEEAAESLKVLESLIAYDADIIETYLLKGYLLQGSKQHLAAAQAFEKYAELRPKEHTIKFFIARNYIAAKEFDKAEPLINLLLKLSEYHPLSNQMKAQIEYERKNYVSAQDFATIAYQKNSKMHQSIIIAGISAYHLKEYEKAYKHLQKVEDDLPSDHIVKKTLVAIKLHLGYEGEAIETINELVDTDNIDSSMFVSAGMGLLKSGELSATEALMEKAGDLDFTTPTDLTKLGVIKLGLNDLESGIEALEKSFELDSTSKSTEAGLAIGYLMNNDFDKVLVIAKSWQESDHKVKGLLLEATVLQKQNKHGEAEKLLEEALLIEPGNVAALFKLGVYKQRNKNVNSALDLYKNVIELSPAHSGAMKGIMSLTYNNKRIINDVIGFYEKQIETNKNSERLMLALAYLHSFNNDVNKALTILDELKKSDRPVKGVDLVIGDIYFQDKQWNHAAQYYKKASENSPESLKVSSKLFAIYEKLGQLSNSLEEVNRIYSFHKDNYGLLLMKVNYQTRLKITPSESELSRLATNEKTKEHWVHTQSLGNMAFLAGDFSLAEKQFRKSYDAMPSGKNVISLSGAVARTTSIDASISLLKSHLSHTVDPNVQSMLANAYLSSKKIDMAEKVYLDLISSYPSHVIALNNLAYIYIESNQPIKALKFAERALKLSPKSSAILDTYGHALLINNHAEKALEQFEQALVQSPDSIDIKINKAEALFQLNKKDESKSLLNTFSGMTKEQQIKVNILLKKLN